MAAAAAGFTGSPRLPVAQQSASPGFILQVASPRLRDMTCTTSSSAGHRQHPLQVPTYRSPRIIVASGLATSMASSSTAASRSTLPKTPQQQASVNQPLPFAAAADSSTASALAASMNSTSSASPRATEPRPPSHAAAMQFPPAPLPKRPTAMNWGSFTGPSSASVSHQQSGARSRTYVNPGAATAAGQTMV